jgi:hypothetical protein
MDNMIVDTLHAIMNAIGEERFFSLLHTALCGRSRVHYTTCDAVLDIQEKLL